MEKKTTLRQWFITKDSNDKQIEDDFLLTSILKTFSNQIIMLLFYGIFSIYIRDLQFKRNMELIEPYLSINKVRIMSSIGRMQYIESVSMLVLTLIISICMLYYVYFKYEKNKIKYGGCNEKNN